MQDAKVQKSGKLVSCISAARSILPKGKKLGYINHFACLLCFALSCPRITIPSPHHPIPFVWGPTKTVKPLQGKSCHGLRGRVGGGFIRQQEERESDEYTLLGISYSTDIIMLGADSFSHPATSKAKWESYTTLP